MSPCPRQFIQDAIRPDYLHDDMQTSASLPPTLWNDVDLYGVGFPCQPFSFAGAKKGVEDARGKIMAFVPAQIDRQKPRSFLVENVLGLLQIFPRHFNLLLETLRNLKDSSGEICFLANSII